MHISSAIALAQLKKSSQLFLELFQHGTLSIEIYKPFEKDYQQPHDRDEVYIIISGSGEFINENTKINFQSGDFLFVPAGTIHEFINFTEDFTTWVIFYGPKGGEANS
jgi:mannose-6-phosphate isomerase-like protein (cupin superfamily)